jgi:hypothetical protein
MYFTVYHWDHVRGSGERDAGEGRRQWWCITTWFSILIEIKPVIVRESFSSLFISETLRNLA